MWELDCEESWVPKNWCFWTVVLEKTHESPLDCKEIQPVHPKGDPSWVFIGRTNVEAETPILWPPDVKSWLIWKDPDAGKDWGKEKGMTDHEMVGWHHWLDGHGFGWTPGVGDGQGGLACCCSWNRKELNMTEWLNWICYGLSCVLQNSYIIALTFVMLECDCIWRRMFKELISKVKWGHMVDPYPNMTGVLFLIFDCTIIALQCCVGWLVSF